MNGTLYRMELLSKDCKCALWVVYLLKVGRTLRSGIFIFFNEKNNFPNKVSMEDTAVPEQLKLINELGNEEKNILLKLIETFVFKKRFKDDLQKNIAAL